MAAVIRLGRLRRMPFADVATTARKKLTPTQRLRIWERDKGVCCLCSEKIDGVREPWILEHVRALELGGADEPANMGPAHKACADAKTNGPTGDHARAAKAKRSKRASLGLKRSKNPLPGSKGSKWRRRMDGTVERRGQ
jgi:5-methylcytosine-specific restriction enzyme A